MVSPENGSVEKDLELLRAEHQQLSATILRFSSLRLLFLFLFTFAFGSALQKVRSLDNADIVAARNQLFDTLRTIQGGPVDFKVAAFVSGSCPTETYEYALDPNNRTGVSLTVSNREKVEPLVRKLCSLYERAFSAPMEVFGMHLEMDLRQWTYVLPILYWFTAVYAYLLRKKLSVVDALANHRIQDAQPRVVSTLDALLFLTDRRGSTAYSRLPTEFLEPFFSVLMLVFFLYLGISFAPFLSIIASQTNYFWPLGHGILILVTCTIVYAHHVTNRLEDQAFRVAGFRPEKFQSHWIKGVRRLSSWWRRHGISLSGRSFPRACMLSSSLMLLATLGLATSMDNCGKMSKGYELARGKTEWLGAAMFASPGGLDHHIIQILGVGAYLTSLLLSVMSLGLLARSIRRFGLLSNRRLMGGAFIVAAGIASFVLSQLSFASTMSHDDPGAPLLSWVWVLYWVAGSFVWCRFALAAIREGRLRWPSRSLLALLYWPQITVLITLFIAYSAADVKPFGLLAYFFGIDVLALAYALYLIRACQTEEAKARAGTPL